VSRLQRDLDEILERNADDFESLRGARLFITGGTGFVGSWLLESFASANARLGLRAHAVVLTRDPDRFSNALPHLAGDESIQLLRGDVCEPIAIDGSFDAVIHAATPASAKVNAESPLLMVDTVVDGTRHALDIARRSGSIPFLFTSSGAVYGRQPPGLALVDESYVGAPDTLDVSNAYHEGKRLAELLCAIARTECGLSAKIARLFAFVGPYLTIDQHFAIGNFIRDALAGKQIEILGDGTPVRTYQYAADMTSWIWRILVRGIPLRAYNVGSERTVDIRETAELVATVAGATANITVRGTPTLGIAPERYACSTARARTELGLEDWTPLEEGLRRTISWHRSSDSGRR
jgi:nucleoside-diphosphate-sugar epimerase